MHKTELAYATKQSWFMPLLNKKSLTQ